MRTPASAREGRDRSRWVLVGLLALFCATAVGLLWWWRPAPGEATGPVLPVLGVVGPFALVDQDGQAYAADALRGNLTVVQVVYSRDTAAGPALLSRFTELDQNFRRSTDLRLLSITADPDFDEPPVLSGLRQRYEGSSRWTFATGGREAVRLAITKSFGFTEVGTSGEDLRAIAGSGEWCLIDRAGFVRARYHGAEPDAVAVVLTDVGNLLRSGKNSGR